MPTAGRSSDRYSHAVHFVILHIVRSLLWLCFQCVRQVEWYFRLRWVCRVVCFHSTCRNKFWEVGGLGVIEARSLSVLRGGNRVTGTAHPDSHPGTIITVLSTLHSVVRLYRKRKGITTVRASIKVVDGVVLPVFRGWRHSGHWTKITC